MKLGIGLGLLVMALAACGAAAKGPSLDACLEDGSSPSGGKCESTFTPVR